MWNNASVDYDLVVKACGCGSLACPHCRNSRAIELRSKIEKAIENGVFSSGYTYFITVTLRHDLSAEKLYHVISSERSVSEFLRRLVHYRYSPIYIVVSECQENGYLHWHYVANFYEKLNYKALYSDGTIKSAWRFGRVNFEPVNDISGVSGYVTKYITLTSKEDKKSHKHPFADWVLKLSHFRVFSTSRGFFGVLTSRVARKSEKSIGEVYNKARSLGERLKSCGSKISIWTKFGDYVKSICISYDDFLKLKPLYKMRGFMRDGWRSAKRYACMSSDNVDWLSDAVQRVKGTGYDSGGSLILPFKIPLSSLSDWLSSAEDRWANSWSYRKDFWGRCYGY